MKREASNLAYAWTGHGDGSTTYDVDGLNRLTSKTTGPTVTSYGHDKRGDRLNDDTRTYAYDSETKGLGSPSAPWHHDPLGRLSGASTSAGTPPAIAYESYVDNLVAERTPGSSTVQRRHVFGPGTDEPLVWYEGPSRRFLHADERGSIVAVTSDAGALLAINRYDEYGRTETTSAAHMGRFLYTGQRWFGGFGLYHYKNRIYDPRVGRFMQPDPIGYASGINLYAYVGGDPINTTDPWGLQEDRCDQTGSRICGGGRYLSTSTMMANGGGGGNDGGGASKSRGCGKSSGTTIVVCGTLPSRSPTLDEFAYTSWLTGSLGGNPIAYNKPPLEPLYYIYDGLIVEDAQVQMKTLTCIDGSTIDRGVATRQPNSSLKLIGVAHVHQGYGFGPVLGFHDPYPGPGDGRIVIQRGIPNYVFADAGLTAVRPGPNSTVAGVDILGNNGLPSQPPTVPTGTAISGGKSCR